MSDAWPRKPIGILRVRPHDLRVRRLRKEATLNSILILILQVLVLVGTGVALVALRNYLPSYLRQKGQNLATKEDIAGITASIEGVRAQYAASLEHLKQSLQAA